MPDMYYFYLMRSTCLVAVLLFGFWLKTEAQEYINYEKSIVINELTAFGFDTLEASTKRMVIDSASVTVLFNEGYCSQLSYFFILDEDGYYICDSMYFSGNCDSCFTVVLDELLADKHRKWKKVNNQLYVAIRNLGYIEYYGPPKAKIFDVIKLEIEYTSTGSPSNMSIHHKFITEELYNHYKKLPGYNKHP